MMKPDTEKRTSNRQKEMAYILYMFMGSYFHRCICKTPGVARYLLLYYKEMPGGKQTRAENQVIRVIETLLERKKLDFEELDCEARINLEDKDYLLSFRTWFEDISIRVKENGEYHIDIIRETAS